MKRGGWVAAGCIGLAMLAVVVFVPPNAARRSAAATRRELREQGFKTDLADFDFTTSPELRSREAALTNAARVAWPQTPDWGTRRSLERGLLAERAWRVGDAAGLCVWAAQSRVDNSIWGGERSREENWAALRAGLSFERQTLDPACAAAIAGPIRFHLDASKGFGMLLPHLASLRSLCSTLAARTILDLHDGDADGAWTNLLATTRLVTAYAPEASEVSHLVRMTCAGVAERATWQWVQSRQASAEQLARLQQEWEGVDYFRGLPETAAFARACAVATCQKERYEALRGIGEDVKEMWRSPRQALDLLKARWARMRSCYPGSYEDEVSLLRYYREREAELREAVKAPDWDRLRRVNGATNRVVFQANRASATLTILNQRQLMLAFQMYAAGGSASPPTLVARAAESECRRRVIVAALALERYRVAHGVYPTELSAVVPGLLPIVPVDFADGQPLRYRPTGDGSFLLYAVGLDGADDGGVMPAQLRPEYYPTQARGAGERPKVGDLIWPRLASETDFRVHHEAERQAAEAEAQARAEAEAEARKEATVRRIKVMTVLGRAYARQRAGLGTEPAREMPDIIRLLRNDNPRAAIAPTFSELLTLKPVAESQPGIVTFDVALHHDALGSSGTVRLLVDALPDEAEGEGGEAQECDRAPDGGCRLRWATADEPIGPHFVRAQLTWDDGTDTVQINGPLRIVNLAEPREQPESSTPVGDP